MTKSRILIISLISCLAFGSCDDFLDVSPETQFAVDNFFETENQVTRAVNAAYVKNRAIHEDLQWRVGENRSDNTSFQYNDRDRGGFLNEELDEFRMTADNPNIRSYWNEAYDGVTRCTYVLQNIDPVPFSSTLVKNQRIGEVLFLRTWYYFNLVRLYGDIPLPQGLVTNFEDALSTEYTERVAEDVVYDSLFNDIDKAVSLLPDSWGTEDVGRATRGAALMLRAKMHMTQDTPEGFASALTDLEEIRTLGYSLVPNYSDVFDPANKNNSESIFEIQYSFELGQGSNFVSRYVPFNSGSDLLFENDLAQPRAGQNQPTQDLIDLYEENDDRLEHNIGFYEAEDEVVPWMQKYAFGFLDVGRTNVNWPMFRYADALLMLAECRNEINDLDQSAIGLVNIVRLRSGVGPINPTSSIELEQAIQDERRRELAFENHRWFDLVRRGEAESVMIAHGNTQKAEKGILGEGGTVASTAYINIRTLLAIPTNQVIQFGYNQNTGWE